MIRLLIGGSPCTHWSIAQKNNRETKPEGEGWELFLNYLIAREKFKPDFFLYENNKSAAQAIKDEIAKRLDVGTDPDARFTYINSALVSAQNRQRFYVTNFGDIEQPEDRGILLRDILEYSYDLTSNDKSFALTASYDGAVARNTLERHQRNMVAEPVCMRYERSEEAKILRKQYEKGEIHHGFHELSELHPRTDGKINTLSTVLKDNPICEPVRVGGLPRPNGEISESQAMRVYSINGKSINITSGGGGMGGEKTGLYAIPVEFIDDVPVKAFSCADGKTYDIYEVKNGLITIKDKQYPIKLPDGYYIIRKLTVTECCRFQTLPDDYCKAVSQTQAYKGLGNGWTAEVIIHLLNHALKDIPKDEQIVVLSMYDGIGTGRYCLDKMGFTNVRYYAYEIDKYAKTVANDNYPDIIQCGNAFDLRNDDWRIDND